MEHAGPFWTERVKTVLDGTNSAHLISESATLKATLALPLNLALPIAKLKFRFGPNKVYSERPPFAVKRGARRPRCSVEVTIRLTQSKVRSVCLVEQGTKITLERRPKTVTTVKDCKVTHGFERTFASSEATTRKQNYN